MRSRPSLEDESFLDSVSHGIKNQRFELPKQSVKRMKNKIREITSRKKPLSYGISNKETKSIPNRMVRIFRIGGYAKRISRTSIHGFEEDFECVYGNNGRIPRTKVRKLIGLGVPKGKAYEWGNTRKSYWRISKSPISTQNPR